MVFFTMRTLYLQHGEVSDPLWETQLKPGWLWEEVDRFWNTGRLSCSWFEKGAYSLFWLLNKFKIPSQPSIRWGILTWPNQDGRMNMTEIWQRQTLFIEHDRKIINIMTTTNHKVWVWPKLEPTNPKYYSWLMFVVVDRNSILLDLYLSLLDSVISNLWLDFINFIKTKQSALWLYFVSWICYHDNTTIFPVISSW